MKTLDYSQIAARARQLWDRDTGPWAVDVDGAPVLVDRGPDDPLTGLYSDIHSARAVSFSRSGAILRAIEETVGVGRATSRQVSAVSARLPERRA